MTDGSVHVAHGKVCRANIVPGCSVTGSRVPRVPISQVREYLVFLSHTFAHETVTLRGGSSACCDRRRDTQAPGAAPGRELSERGLTIIIVEHVMRAIMAVAHHVIVLDHG